MIPVPNFCPVCKKELTSNKTAFFHSNYNDIYEKLPHHEVVYAKHLFDARKNQWFSEYIGFYSAEHTVTVTHSNDQSNDYSMKSVVRSRNEHKSFHTFDYNIINPNIFETLKNFEIMK